MYLYLFVPVLCIRGLKMGWAMGRVWVWVWVWDVGCWCWCWCSTSVFQGPPHHLFAQLY